MCPQPRNSLRKDLTLDREREEVEESGAEEMIHRVWELAEQLTSMKADRERDNERERC